MHETHLVNSVIKSLEEKVCKQDDIDKIIRVKIKIGKLKLVTPQSFYEIFQQAPKDIKLKNTELVVEQVEGDELIIESIEAEYK